MLALLSCIQAFLTQVDDKVGTSPSFWRVGSPLLHPGPPGAFDEAAVKDPTIVHDGERWHLFYTARGGGSWRIGYVCADTLERLSAAPRTLLSMARGEKDTYAAAPQVFLFAPQSKWYLIYQTRDAEYQPVYSTTASIEDANSWSEPTPLVEKSDPAKWIDFWIICDDATAYLFYTRAHQDVYVMMTPLGSFPKGFSDPRPAFSPVHEAVHVYKAKGLDEYHMFYELCAPSGRRGYGLATAPHLLGPWTKATDSFATGPQLIYDEPAGRWTEEVSHGEMIRTGHDQRLEYDASATRFLLQGLRTSEHTGPYTDLPWRLGIIERE